MKFRSIDTLWGAAPDQTVRQCVRAVVISAAVLAVLAFAVRTFTMDQTASVALTVAMIGTTAFFAVAVTRLTLALIAAPWLPEER